MVSKKGFEMSYLEYRARRRHGLVLLIALIMLALFSLLIITYVVFTTQSRSVSSILSRESSRSAKTAVDDHVDVVISEAICGTNNPKSALYGHDVLGDLYGVKSRLTLGRNVSAVRDQMTDQISWPIETSDPFLTEYRVVGFERVNGGNICEVKITTGGNNRAFDNASLSGRVLTFASGKWKGVSGHVLYNSMNTIYVQLIGDIPEGAPRNREDLVLINDQVLDGFGFGYNKATTNIDKVFRPYAMRELSSDVSDVMDVPISFLNDFAEYSVRDLGGRLPYGATDETYDAPDYSDFYLRFGNVPSYHRPAILQYLFDKFNSQWNSASPEMQQRLVVALFQLADMATPRPLAYKIKVNGNPDFLKLYDAKVQGQLGQSSGREIVGQYDFVESGPAKIEVDLSNIVKLKIDQFFNYHINGPWDVDTDGDSFPDAVWMDPGLAPISSPSGKTLKVLVAISVEDMDGKLNLNTASSWAELRNNYNVSISDVSKNPVVGSQGFGFGSAEISLLPLNLNLQYLLASRYRSQEAVAVPMPSRDRFEEAASFFLNRDRYSFRKHGNAHGLPFNIFGDVCTTLDHHGNFILRDPASLPSNNFRQNMNEWVNDPYEGFVLRENSSDSYFTMPELEQVIYPGTYSTPENRLRSLLSNNNSKLVTVRSVEVSNPRVPARIPEISSMGEQVPLDATKSLYENPMKRWVGQLVAEQAKYLGVVVSYDNAILPNLYEQLFPREFDLGRLMDLNRPLANGLDDDDDGQIDEPNESNGIDDDNDGRADEYGEINFLAQIERIYKDSQSEDISGLPGVQIARTTQGDYLRGKVVNPRDPYDRCYETRQIMARELYCLAQAVIPMDYVFPEDPNATYPAQGTAYQLKYSDPQSIQQILLAPNLKEDLFNYLNYRARRIAQWAVNVVDFRDSDAAMTRFEYDATPFFDLNNTGNSFVPASFWEPEVAGGARPYSNVVWGLEQPELLLSEGVAFHDYRVADTDKDSGSRAKLADGDTDLDQYRLPEGSLFLELYNPRTTSGVQDNNVDAYNPAGVASGLYSATGDGETALDLSKVTPPSNSWKSQPVWRVVLSEWQNDQAESPREIYGDPEKRRRILYQISESGANPNNGLPYDLTKVLNPESSGSVLKAPKPERIIWFTPSNMADPDNYNTGEVPDLPQGAKPRERIYFNRGSNYLLRGGQYLVVGPREETILGSHSNQLMTHTRMESPQRIKMMQGHLELVSFRDAGGSTRPANLFFNNDTQEWEWVNKPVLTMLAAAHFPQGLENEWRDVLDGISPGIGLSISEPLPSPASYYRIPTTDLNSTDNSGFDGGGAESWFDFKNASAPGTLPDTPLDFEYLGKCDAIVASDYKTGHFGNVKTAFLQRVADPELPFDPVKNPYITVDWLPLGLTCFNGEDEKDPKGSEKPTADGASEPIILSSQKTWESPTTSLRRGETVASFSTNLAPATLKQRYKGYQVNYHFNYTLLADNFHTVRNQDDKSSQLKNHVVTLGEVNQGISMELFRPLTSGGQFQYSPPDVPKPFFAYNGQVIPSYRGVPKGQVQTVQLNNRPFASTHELMLVPLSHPGQLFQETSLAQTATPWETYKDTVDGDGARFLPFNHLPNFFDNSVTDDSGNRTAKSDWNKILTLIEVNSPWADSNEVVDRVHPSINGYYSPPFNAISTFRTPGKVNINTLAGSQVWSGIERHYSENAGFENDSFPFINNTPNTTPRVFKSPWYSSIAPLPTFQRSWIDVTLNATSSVSGSPKMLFEPITNISHANHSPFAYYQRISRLPNLVSTSSNVFSISCVLGYFEYDSSRDRILLENGVESNTVVRPRRRVIVDRSIPVGYQPGRSVNMERIFLTPIRKD